MKEGNMDTRWQKQRREVVHLWWTRSGDGFEGGGWEVHRGQEAMVAADESQWFTFLLLNSTKQSVLKVFWLTGTLSDELTFFLEYQSWCWCQRWMNNRFPFETLAMKIFLGQVYLGCGTASQLLPESLFVIHEPIGNPSQKSPPGSRLGVLLSPTVWNICQQGGGLAIEIACFTAPPPMTTRGQVHTHSHTHTHTAKWTIDQTPFSWEETVRWAGAGEHPTMAWLPGLPWRFGFNKQAHWRHRMTLAPYLSSHYISAINMSLSLCPLLCMNGFFAGPSKLPSRLH
jgi:hypothetical protein